MKKVIMLCALAVMVVVSSCKKDLGYDTQQNQQLEGLKANNLPPNFHDFVHRELPENIEAKTQLFKVSYLADLGKMGDLQRPIACPRYSRSSSILTDNSSGVCTPETPVTLTYRCNVIELPGADPTLSIDYKFKMLIGGSITIVGSKTLIRNDEFCNGQDPIVLVCPRLKSYDVIFIIPANLYNGFGGGGLITEVEVPCTIVGVTNSSTENVAFYYPQSYYETRGPIIYIHSPIIPNQHKFDVYGQCNLLCIISPFIPCPLQSVFLYRKINTTTWLSTNVPNPIGISVASSGIYEYQCTLNYGTYTSLPGTGTFVVN